MAERVEKVCSAVSAESFDQRAHSARTSSRLWSPKEIRQLRELADAGVPTQSIAASLHRTVSAVKNKACIHGISVRSAPLPCEPVG